MSVQVPAGYKQTEVGLIPEEWSVSTIGENTKWLSGGTPSRSTNEFWQGEIPWISGSTLKHTEISTSDQFLSIGAIAAGSKMAPLESTLLLVRGSALHNEIRAGLVVAHVSFNQDVKALIPTRSIEPKFLTFYILGNTDKLLKLVSSAGNSAGVLDTKLVQNFTFLKPPRKEQKIIAETLSDADALIESLDQLIAKKHQIKQGAMQALLTGQQRLPEFGGEWLEKPLGELSDISKGQLITESLAIPGDIPVIAGGKKPAYFHNTPNRKGKTISISGSGASAGYVSFHKTPIFASDCSTIQESDNYSIEFLYYTLLLKQHEIYNSQTGGAQPHIHPIDLHPLIVNFPTDKKEQDLIATILNEMDTEISMLEARLSKARKIKQAMAQELLTGRIRLV